MKKNDKYKPFAKTTLFGEKLALAREQKINIEKPLPTAPTKKDLPVIVAQPVIEESKTIEKTGDIKSIESEIKIEKDKIEINNDVSTPATTVKTEPSNEYRQIMERQFEENLSLVKPILINLGVDLGTSFSKVVWRRIGGENSYPVCFGKNRQKLTNYLVPSTVSLDKTKVICGVDSEVNFAPLFSLANFKMCLACESDKNGDCSVEKCSLTKWHLKFFKPVLENDEAAFTNSFFLAKLLAAAKKSIIAQLEASGLSQPLTIKWTANFSVPEKYIEKSDVADSFETVFKIAWLMAAVFVEKPDLTERKSVFQIYSTAKNLAEELTIKNRPFDCFPYSEVGAEVASVVKTSKEGLYAFDDIGAGTIDASVFRFSKNDGETKFISYAVDIFKLGAAHIETRANRQFTRNSARWLKEVKEEYLNLTENERGQLLKPIISFLEEAAGNIKDESCKSLNEVFSRAYHDKECNENRWQDLKLILGGGGSKLKSYQDAAVSAFTLNKNGSEPKMPTTVILLKPTDFQMFALPETEFYRFAVAYGLSHERAMLPETNLAKDVAPMLKVSETKNKRNRDDDR